ncbi:type VI secretion system PAAR protein [Aeromonas dhakensis]|nr:MULTISPECIES: type VI secretion system PAAR protein [Aeromonas]QSR43228.1 type VI secretion system PAAR protein [Aeromonas dhakensis]
MSKNAAKVGDIGTDHDGFHPTAITAGSPDVFIDGIPAARVGDPLAPHDKPNNPPHPRTIASGSSTVLVNGKPLAITGGAVDCGGVIIGSGTVIVGDQAPAGQSSFIPRVIPWFDTSVRLLGSTGDPLANFKFTYTDDAGKTHRAMTGPDGVATGLAKSQKPQKITVEGSSKSWLVKGK